MGPRQRTRARAFAVMVCAGVALGVPLAHGQAARTGGSANAQLLQQLQQLASERTGMQAENARLKKELESLKRERDSLQSARKAQDQHAAGSAAALAQSTAQREALEQELKRNKDQTQELVAKFRETLQTMRDIESDRATSKQSLATRDQELKVCVDRNLALYKLNLEVLTRLEHQSILSRVAAAEPFTQLKRVQLENLVDDYKGRAQDQRVTEQSLRARGGPPPETAPH